MAFSPAVCNFNITGKSVIMEFNEKLQELRKNKGLTQEELAGNLYVSRTAISKWESGRGYPNIDSLKAIAKFFSVTIDELLSGDEVLTIAEEESKVKAKRFCDIVYGLLDLSVAMFFFLPLFRESTGIAVNAVPLSILSGVALYTKTAYFIAVISMVIMGIVIFALSKWDNNFWVTYKSRVSEILNAMALLLFAVSLQPYAVVLLFIYLIIKESIRVKRR